MFRIARGSGGDTAKQPRNRHGEGTRPQGRGWPGLDRTADFRFLRCVRLLVRNLGRRQIFIARIRSRLANSARQLLEDLPVRTAAVQASHSKSRCWL